MKTKELKLDPPHECEKGAGCRVNHVREMEISMHEVDGFDRDDGEVFLDHDFEPATVKHFVLSCGAEVPVEGSGWTAE